jgi:ElaB/YqjD/DUF883 family membrane-anchored ribosome-binding protein
MSNIINNGIVNNETSISKHVTRIVSNVKSKVKGALDKICKTTNKALDSITVSVERQSPEAAQAITNVRDEISNFNEAHPHVAAVAGIGLAVGSAVSIVTALAGAPILSIASLGAASVLTLVCIYFPKKVEKCIEDAISG